MNEFGNYLYSLRKAKGMTQQEVADVIGVTNKAVSKWETGEAFPETALLVPLSDLFGVTVDDLLRGRASTEGSSTQSTHECASNDTPLEENPDETRKRIVEKYTPPKWKKQFALLICFGVGLILAGVLTMIIFGLITEDDAALTIGAAVMLALIAVGVDFCTAAGILNDDLYLPVSDPMWKKNVKRFAVFMISGLSSMLAAVICFVLFSVFEEQSTPFIAGMVCGFVLLFLGVSLFVFGGITWDGYSKQIKASLREKPDLTEQDAFTALSTEDRKKSTLAGKLSGALMTTAVAIFLLIGFVWNLWHPGWVIFPVAAILCGVLSILFDKSK